MPDEGRSSSSERGGMVQGVMDSAVESAQEVRVCRRLHSVNLVSPHFLPTCVLPVRCLLHVVKVCITRVEPRFFKFSRWTVCFFLPIATFVRFLFSLRLELCHHMLSLVRFPGCERSFHRKHRFWGLRYLCRMPGLQSDQIWKPSTSSLRPVSQNNSRRIRAFGSKK